MSMIPPQELLTMMMILLKNPHWWLRYVAWRPGKSSVDRRRDDEAGAEARTSAGIFMGDHNDIRSDRFFGVVNSV